jgi:SAM-dependent methyltransferase
MMIEIFPPNPPFHPGHISHFEPHDKPIMHRKIWEWAIGMLALKKLGKLNKDSLALGIGCGSELPSFYLTNMVRYVFCTDLYPVGREGTWYEASRDMLTHPEVFSPINFNRRRLGVQVMDGQCIAFEDDTFDIVFSYSSIEHFGGKDAASRTMQEIQRVLKPGGVASITTEVTVSSNYDQLGRLRAKDSASNQKSILSEIFTPAEVDMHLISSHDMTIFNKIDYNVRDKRGIIKFPEEVTKMPHIFLEYSGIIWGSLHLTMIKS